MQNHFVVSLENSFLDFYGKVAGAMAIWDQGEFLSQKKTGAQSTASF